MRRLMAMLTAVVMLAAMIPLSMAAAGDPTTMTVRGGWLRLRQSPSFSARTLASYYTGTVVTVTGVSGSWYQVVTPDNRTGYMYGTYLTTGGTTPAPAPVPDGGVGNAVVTSQNGRGVRMRSGPGTGYSVIKTYAVGTKVTILSRGTTWNYIRVGSRTGYMMNQFLAEGTSPSPAPAPVPSATYTAYVTSQNGLGVRLRSGAGTSCSVLGTYSVGTAVTVLSHGTTWDRITVGTRTGYMMNKFLTTSAPAAVVSAVSVSKASPVVGDVLSAAVIPATASVSYAWYDDAGILLSSASTCTVGAGQLGRRIRVVVGGTGNTVGTATSAYTAKVTAAVVPVTPVLTGSASIPAGAYAGVTIYPTVSVNVPSYSCQWYQNGVLIGSGSSLTTTAAMAGSTISLVVVGSGYSGSVVSGGCLVYGAVSTMSDLTP